MNVSISAPMPIEYVISSWRENRSSKTRVIISRHCDHLNCTFFHNHAVFPMRMRQSVCGQTYWNLNDLRRTDLLWWIRVTVSDQFADQRIVVRRNRIAAVQVRINPHTVAARAGHAVALLGCRVKMSGLDSRIVLLRWPRASHAGHLRFEDPR